jgi:2-C-methyl-D-erythritol 4-phosphate cytidylyltransferase
VRVAGIVPAAGIGERLGSGGPKAFAPCAGRPLLHWSLDVLAPACDVVAVALPPGESIEWDELGAVEPADRVIEVEGGPSRSASVRLALEAAGDADVAVVHDAARPMVTHDLVARCVSALRGGWDGAVAAAPVPDTVKEVEGEALAVVRTPDRSRLWAVQTPQVFGFDALRRGLDVDEETLAAATDDASLVEAAGGRVRLVEAPPENLKVTSAADLLVAEALLRERIGATS